MYRWVDHTSEVELEIEATSEREVFADALRALAELHGLHDDGAIGVRSRNRERRAISVSASDRPAMLAAWLEELLFLAESQGFVGTELERLELSDGELVATVSGHLDDPPPLVKAVTYHRLVFEPGGAGYVARLILDV